MPLPPVLLVALQATVGRHEAGRAPQTPLVTYDYEDEPEAPYLTVKVEVCSLDHRIWIDSTDGSVDGYLVRPGQEEAYDQLKKVVEEQGLVEEMDEEWEKAGTFQKRSTACLFVHYMGKSEDGQRMLKINVKQVQPFVKWG